ncbi:MAG TPA: DnaJ domain-containing protein [Kofleriaceae bacterium]|nr:DnaJ domain-containing protein [Kofleriaceae bacterium]
MANAERDAYRVLQVDPHADPDVIAAAYRVLARRLHPDRGGADADRMAELNAAYARIRDPEERRAYDRERRAGIQRSAAPTVVDPDGVPYSQPSDGRLDFGRYAGWTLEEVARRDLDYLRWLQRHASGARHRAEIGQLLRRYAPPEPAPRR